MKEVRRRFQVQLRVVIELAADDYSIWRADLTQALVAGLHAQGIAAKLVAEDELAWRAAITDLTAIVDDE